MVAVKLRCSSWEQLAYVYQNDIKRGIMFLRSQNPPDLGTEMRIDLILPSGSVAAFEGKVVTVIPPGEGRGPGVELSLIKLSPGVLWMIESALRTTAKVEEDIIIDTESPEAEVDLLVALEAERRGLERLDPYQILGLRDGAGDEEVRDAFAELSKRVHPDRYAQYESEEVRLLASEIFMAVREAYRKVATAEARSRLAGARAKRPPPPPVSIDENAALDEARRLVEAGNYDRAVPIYDMVARKNPQNRVAGGGRELCEGLRLLAGDPLAAAERIEAAVELDPGNERAARELQSVRRTVSELRQKFLAKLLGRED
jgi:hypothetical protein